MTMMITGSATTKGVGHTVGVMQPYLFPYLGYFQLIQAVDKFVFLDNVSFIKKGWINRNRVLLNGQAHTFTFPLRKQSQNVDIKDTNVALDDGWKKKIHSLVSHAYAKAPNFRAILPLVEKVLESRTESIGGLAEESVRLVLEHLEMDVPLFRSSELTVDGDLKGEDRILGICDSLGASVYINPSGGRDLYHSARFRERHIELRFIQMEPVSYVQGSSNEFVPGLSMIDVLMWNDRIHARSLLSAHSIQE